MIAIGSLGRQRGQQLVQAMSAGRLDLFIVLSWALGLRLLFALLTSTTFDADEFVFLGLSQSFAHGAVPYRDFLLFHPPGILVILRGMQPLISLWWPLARGLPLLADVATAVLTWRIGLQLYGRRGGLAAGLLYGASPLALITAVRVGPDPLITVLGVGGLALLVTKRSQRSALLAGVLLGVAVWIKYPALLFLPVYVLVAPRRALTCVFSALLVAVLLFAPFAPSLHDIVQQSVVWQRDRPSVPLDLRLQSVAEYWLLLNILALPAILLDLSGILSGSRDFGPTRGSSGFPGLRPTRGSWVTSLPVRPPRWVMAGFCLGAAFILSPQVYYHYLVPIVPFAALLAAPLVVRAVPWLRFALVPAALGLTIAWGLAIDHGTATMRLSTSASHFSEIRPVIRYLQRSTSPGSYILTDRFEFAFLAHRRNLADYYWNMHGLVSATYLERRLDGVSVVVVTDGATTYPDGFVAYLADHLYSKLTFGATDVWLHPSGEETEEAACLTGKACGSNDAEMGEPASAGFSEPAEEHERAEA